MCPGHAGYGMGVKQTNLVFAELSQITRDQGNPFAQSYDGGDLIGSAGFAAINPPPVVAADYESPWSDWAAEGALDGFCPPRIMTEREPSTSRS